MLLSEGDRWCRRWLLELALAVGADTCGAIAHSRLVKFLVHGVIDLGILEILILGARVIPRADLRVLVASHRLNRYLLGARRAHICGAVVVALNVGT